MRQISMAKVDGETEDEIEAKTRVIKNLQLETKLTEDFYCRMFWLQVDFQKLFLTCDWMQIDLKPIAR